MARANNIIRQVSTLQSLELSELNRILRKMQGDIAGLQGYKGVVEQRDALNLLSPPADPILSATDSTTIFHDPSLLKLRASESGETFGDMLNSLGAWRSSNTITSGLLSFSAEVIGSDVLFNWNQSDTITIKQSGQYVLFYRGHGTADAGGDFSLRLLISGTRYDKVVKNLIDAEFPVVEVVPLDFNLGQVPADITLELLSGASFGGSVGKTTYLGILKVR